MGGALGGSGAQPSPPPNIWGFYYIGLKYRFSPKKIGFSVEPPQYENHNGLTDNIRVLGLSVIGA